MSKKTEEVRIELEEKYHVRLVPEAPYGVSCVHLFIVCTDISAVEVYHEILRIRRSAGEDSPDMGNRVVIGDNATNLEIEGLALLDVAALAMDAEVVLWVKPRPEPDYHYGRLHRVGSVESVKELDLRNKRVVLLMDSGSDDPEHLNVARDVLNECGASDLRMVITHQTDASQPSVFDVSAAIDGYSTHFGIDFSSYIA